MGSKVMLVFIPSPGQGHLWPMLEMAKLLVARESLLSITVLLFKFQALNAINHTAESLDSSTASDRIHFVDLLQDTVDPANQTIHFFISSYVESQKPHARSAVAEIESAPQPLAGLVIDMFCAHMTDVAYEFGIPFYLFFPSNSAFLSFGFRFTDLNDQGKDDWSEYESVEVPGFRNRVPVKVIPVSLKDKASAQVVCNLQSRFRKAKGILVNTFAELELNWIKALSSWDGEPVPTIYPVGPLISISPGETDARLAKTADRKEEIVAWLDRQPPSSVVFLCFGSLGSFEADQVREIATALERADIRFLWSLRRPAQKGVTPLPPEYEDPNEVLPEGFLDRTAGIGKVIGWAPQVTVLAHPAVGGFVSHCGWDSTLESIWHGVPLATWPLTADQHMNAFQMVKELGLAVEITLDYRLELGGIVEADKIEKGIRSLMGDGSEAIRKRVKEMSEYSRKALLPGGCSFTSLSSFINEIV